MSFFLTPRYVPSQFGHCNKFAYAPLQPVQRYVIRPQQHPLASFLGFFDSALDELEREVRRETHRQRRQHKQLIRAHFVVNENGNDYQVDGELPMFEQENITLEVTDSHTIKVTGNTEQKAEKSHQCNEHVTKTTESQSEKLSVGKEDISTTTRPHSPTPSETTSDRSYQATVEDDFEDLGAEMTSAPSTTSVTSAGPKEPRGKEKAVQPQPEEASPRIQDEAKQSTEVQQPIEPQQEDRTTYTFERTFRFAERIEGANVTASFKNGLLSIVVPKSKAPGLMKIQIQ